MQKYSNMAGEMWNEMMSSGSRQRIKAFVEISVNKVLKIKKEMG